MVTVHWTVNVSEAERKRARRREKKEFLIWNDFNYFKIIKIL